MTGVRVDRLRIRGGPPELAGRLPAERLVAGLDLARSDVPDRSILVVRRLDLEARTQRGRVRESGLRRQAADRMAELRARAVRPARAPDAADAALAVVFADESELLACLTRDVISGQLARRWYWSGSVPAIADRGSTLTAAWLARARWLPNAAVLLSPTERLAAVALLTPAQARVVLAAVLAERGAGSSDPLHPTARRRGSGLSEPPGALGSVGSPAVASTSDHGPDESYAAWPGFVAPAQQALVALLAAAVESPALLALPDFQTRIAGWAAEPAPESRLDDADIVTPQRFSPPEGGQAVAEPQPAYCDDQAHRIDDTVPVEEPVDQPHCQPVDDAPVDERAVALRVQSRCAGALYLVNLWPVLGSWLAERGRRGPVGPRRLARGWSLLELLARALLTEEQAAADDPLWACLAELDGRRPGARPRGRLPTGLVAQVSDLLQQHRIDRTALATPGWLVAGRTHLEVEIDIEAIDLAVRVAGLDRDPGWVPELGRVVSFHFGSAT
jgi:hypothetical protein